MSAWLWALLVVLQCAAASKRTGVLQTVGTRGGGNTTYFMCVLAQLKNEEAILTEWINNYLREGFEHLFLIDDGSDDASQRILRPYVTKGLATVLRDVRKDRNPPSSMVERYNLLFKPHLHSCTWFAHVDLDEFMYSRHIPLSKYLDSLSPDVGLLRLPWKNFGSSGYVSRPPLGLVQSMVWRRRFEKLRMNVHTKCIFRGAAVAGGTLTGLGVHDVEIKPGYMAGFPYSRGAVSPAVEAVDGKELSDEEVLGRMALHINHYPVRWREWFMAVKTTRGIADRDVSVYNEDYFKAFDLNDVLDDELSRVSELSGRDPVAFVPRSVAAQS